jgi:hypothetical protein
VIVMSAFGGKADISANSMSAFDPERTLAGSRAIPDRIPSRPPPARLARYKCLVQCEAATGRGYSILASIGKLPHMPVQNG